ncbi:fimbrial protein (plasmid) [Pseudomonas sp. BF61]|uniref:fimbrial protein n=1 Tax=Pseudomonas sp. BF61 TaxID=2741068 RepID=UPI001C0D96D1|nr:fimbrial protein [Pseudomonas sp. BF61]MBU4630957.1 fimbrial protein [Pseudomonas sp. BF61]
MATETSRRYARRILCVALVALGATAQPVMATSYSTIDVTVILTAEPCKVNNNNIIEVNFGNDVQTTLVDGNYKKMQVPYTVQCPAGAPSAMNIRIDGKAAAFNRDVLMTNISNFGIAILNDGNLLPINSPKDFTYPNLPRLYAVPVKRTGATLRGGVFSAGAVMRVEYR